MKAMLCSSFGDITTLKLDEVDEPQAQPGEAVIDIKSVGLNFFDVLMVQGKYQLKPPFPFSPGAEVAGTVLSVGDGRSPFKPGDRVVASCGFNGARERIALPTASMLKIPDSLDFDAAAAILVTYGTATYALTERASLKPGETMAVLGAAGGTGMAACEIGKLLGLKVIACASTEDKLDLACQHGAELRLNYATTDLKEGLRQLTDGKGVDLVFDPVGGALAEPALRAIAWEGRYLVIGFAAGDIPKMPLNLPLLKGCDIRGVIYGAWSSRFPERNQVLRQQLIQWAANGNILPHVGQVFPLSETVAALEVLAGRKAKGKIVLHP